MRIVLAIWNPRYKWAFLTLSVVLVAGIAFADWATKPYVSLGFFYLFPILLCAAYLPRWALVLAGLGCSGLSMRFSELPPSMIRTGFEALALIGCGLFVHELSRNQRLVVASQEQMRVLIGTSPAAIITVDRKGLIEQANDAAVRLLRPPLDATLVGSPIAAFIPELHYALRLDAGPQFRSELECNAHRGDSETFPAEVWFSTYLDGEEPKLAAIITDISGRLVPVETNEPATSIPKFEMSAREQELLALIVQGLSNKEIAERLNLSESSVKNILQGIFAKTGVRSRSQLVRVALEQYRNFI